MSRWRLCHKVARELERELRPKGFTVSLTGAHHLRWRHTATGRVFYTPATPNDWQQVRKSVRAKLRRIGARQ